MKDNVWTAVEPLVVVVCTVTIRCSSNSPASLDDFLCQTLSTAVFRDRWTELWSVALFALLGTLSRMELADWLGETCSSSPWVGWLASSDPLCFSSDGIYRMGSIFFADFGANMIGCFLMGLLASAASLGWLLQASSPLALASPQSWLQRQHALQVGLRSGFCGTLTTFSSWNSQMVVMIFGTGTDTNSAILKAIFGYIIGMQTAMASLAFGKTLARWIFAFCYPQLAAEEAAALERTRQGVFINPNLPEFERKFLPDLLPYLHMQLEGGACCGAIETSGEVTSDSDLGAHYNNMDRFMHLVKWRKSTSEARRIGHAMLNTLNEIEEAVLVNETPIPTHAEAIGRNAEWKVDELLAWAASKQHTTPDLKHVHSTESSVPYILLFGLLYLASGATLAFFHYNNKYESSSTYRTAAFSLLLAPWGAWLRWMFEDCNSRRWLPLGTFTVNFFGSLLSVASIAVEYKLYKTHQDFSFWKFASLRAIRIGFCGSLTTVSNMAEEVASLIKRKREDLAYVYTFLTIGLSGVLGSVVYGVVLHYYTPA